MRRYSSPCCPPSDSSPTAASTFGPWCQLVPGADKRRQNPCYRRGFRLGWWPVPWLPCCQLMTANDRVCRRFYSQYAPRILCRPGEAADVPGCGNRCNGPGLVVQPPVGGCIPSQSPVFIPAYGFLQQHDLFAERLERAESQGEDGRV